jgi:D-sedoheptulose 7-phosphate isomerase
MTNNLKQTFLDSMSVKNEFVNRGQLIILESIGDAIVQSIRGGGKIMLCGNGGSAADAQHLAAEMLVRLRPAYNRESIPAIALAQDTSTITACGNDLGYDYLFERLVSSLGNKGDVLIGITTSGNSKNVILAMNKAKSMGIRVCGFLGSDGGIAFDLCDHAIIVPSYKTGRIQEVHITAGHALMEYVEDCLLEEAYLHLSN